MKRAMGLLAVILGTGLAWGGNGGASGEFLSLPAGARLAAMGEGGIALVDDASALYWNPGALTNVQGKSAILGHGAYLDSSYFDYAGYAQGIGKRSAFGASLQYYSAGSIEGLDESLQNLGNFTPKDLAVTGGYAIKTGAGSFGASGKYVQSKLVDSASTLSADVGYLSPGLVKDKLRVALAATNLMGSLKFEQEANDLPRTYRVGAGYAVKPTWDLAGDLVMPKEGDSYFTLGTEYRPRVMEPWGLALRGGYTSRTQDIDGTVGFTLGLGVTRGGFGVDYAFVPYGDVGSTHWITLGYRWGAKATAPPAAKAPSPIPAPAKNATKNPAPAKPKPTLQSR